MYFMIVHTYERRLHIWMHAFVYTIQNEYALLSIQIICILHTNYAVCMHFQCAVRVRECVNVWMLCAVFLENGNGSDGGNTNDEMRCCARTQQTKTSTETTKTTTTTGKLDRTRFRTHTTNTHTRRIPRIRHANSIVNTVCENTSHSQPASIFIHVAM